MLEAVRNHIALDIPTDLIKQINAAAKGEDESKKTFDAPQKKTDVPQETGSVDKIQEQNEAPADSADERIRVKATLIDKLTNFAGELSISRAHMEQQQGEFKKNLVEMEQTVVRLREQFRLLEIENDAQIRSHFDDNDKEFDPLELDCFSIIQQLSRSLTESVDDLVNIQDYLKTLTRQSDSLLVQQSRIGAELQDGIMRTRMIPFAKISPRLQRIVRGEVREQKKPVKFIINGENIEFERTVLERVVTPLEHMLRNAIGHGIEDAKTRQKSGKSSVANITIDISREGAELIIKLSDDGAGLNLPAIRQKAEERGLIQANTVVNDHELKQLILKPGFTTAKKLTQSQGRGVGMDIVNTDIKKLSGNLQIQSKTGEGTTFEIRLPLSLTITQALLVHIGEETMAVPINYLDAVMRTPRSEVLGEANEVRYYKYMDQKYRVFHLGELLGFGQVASVDSPLIPTLLVHVADRRVALLVDAIEGSKEIVVKPVGPQIEAIRWIAGATILGDGRVVLVLNMPIIVREESTLQSISSQRDAIVQAEKPVVKTVMVVDDSITVRKVTASLLKRQGMEVITAKDGLDAVAKLRENIPDLILLDVDMPRMDGYELGTLVRNNPDWKDLPIIMITTRMGEKHQKKAEKIGINCYLGKPYKENVLLENINALLENKKC
ncbi:Chemotaxis protein CheA [Candidatus Thiomargarita nelsonii]|uniref:Chemotaxis protein CheA n=1 Tax=Candidatus Thiomargarita nelsonii TaxID=1003181 RepID=A0A176S039_9GAMM|nr:Chemotaxis protein CheA [Candidatus Thiomargarita nelsonii]